MGRDKKNKPKKPKKYLRSNTLINLDSEDSDKILFFKSNQVKIPYGKTNGSDTEQKVMAILEESNIPPNLILEPKIVKIPAVGDIEISDGIILYGDTAFLMQIKSRNKEIDDVAGDFTTEKKKIERLISKAYSQTLDSLDYIEKQGEVTFDNKNNERVNISYKDYNWISLILINHAELNEINSIEPLEYDNDINRRKVPRVIMSLQDLEDMSNVFKRVPYYILNYLRRMQYQSAHELGNDMRRFANFVIEDIHDYNRINFFIEFEKVISNLYESKQISKEASKDLLCGLDLMSIKALSNQQAAFRGQLEKVLETPLKDSFMMPHNGTGYVALFYNSQKMPTDADRLWEVTRAGRNYMQRVSQESGRIKRVIAIAVDVSKVNPLETVGVLLGSREA